MIAIIANRAEPGMQIVQDTGLRLGWLHKEIEGRVKKQ
jgi:hypothetical protein